MKEIKKANFVCETCRDKGKVYSPELGCFVPCPECAKRRQDEVQKTNFSTKMGMSAKNLSGELVLDAIFPDKDKYMKDSIEKEFTFIANLYSLYKDSSFLEKPEFESACICLGETGRIELCALPIMQAAYESGYTVAKLISSRDLCAMQRKYDSSYGEVRYSDVVFIVMPDVIPFEQLSSCKSLMRERASLSLPTYFVTNAKREDCSLLLNRNYNEKGEVKKSCWAATGVSLVKK